MGTAFSSAVEYILEWCSPRRLTHIELYHGDLETLGLHEADTYSQDEVDHATHKFNMADTDNDGYITRTEFDNIYVRETGALPPDRMYSKFDAADVDGDGNLSWDEFLLARRRHHLDGYD
jgi:hypothetical protein